ncbi:protein furry isoform X3 [Chrysoperla carnea]|uniref:protein furry isoform X3 n=1 Tax=Chrysoperla carnea TaxID=189513 RepID=UPI001D069723|nr:protein furry isoform X3 [Chrysoperla carnea]
MRKNKIAFKIMADTNFDQISDPGNDNSITDTSTVSGTTGPMSESDASIHSESGSPSHSDGGVTSTSHSSSCSASGVQVVWNSNDIPTCVSPMAHSTTTYDHQHGDRGDHEKDYAASTPAGANIKNTNFNCNDSTSTTNVNTINNPSLRVGQTTVLPWGAQKERSAHPAGCYVNIDMDIRPGEFVMRTLFADFTIQAERKMEAVMAEPLEKPLSKVLQRGEDAQFDQLLSAFGSVAEHCLPSLLRALFAWYERQMAEGGAIEQKKVDQKNKSIMYIVSGGSAVETVERSEADIQQERRDLAVEFIFCLVLIEVLKQLSFHPGHEDLVNYIENIAFKHFKYREGQHLTSGSGVANNATNIHIIADLYAEVIGALAQSRFMSVRKRFMNELKELRGKEPSPHTTQSIISLLMGMKFFRVKMVPIEEFEASFQFMQEAAQYFLEVKDKDIKHALAGLFVEILVPVAATVKNEVNVPCLKNFVEMLYSQTLDASTKSKHRLALFPLVTCLLCVSQKTFFLQNWHYFLAMCLSHLKNRDPKMCRVALESLYRLLWVYMIRIKCESNSATQSRLQSIVNSLFPKGSKAVVPRDTPLNIFVKIIQFIAQERLDFAMREIVFDLLSVGRPIKMILTPERMSIGLRAFLVVADSLQQKEGEPPMPRTMGVLPSGNTLRVKKTFLNKMLTEDTARSIGMSPYFPHVRRVFVDILRALDVHYGRPLMMTSTQNVNKEPDEMITGERKPRIDLFRTCVAAVPRLIPDGMTGNELVDLLSRLTVHMDEELRALAYQSLQTLVIDFPDWRQDVLWGFTQFLARDVLDTFPSLVDQGLRMLLQLLNSWKLALIAPTTSSSSSSSGTNNSSATATSVGPTMFHTKYNKDSPNVVGVKKLEQKVEPTISSVLHLVEAFALVMLCNCRLNPRRIAAQILREAKTLFKQLGCTNHDGGEPVIDVIDRCLPTVMESVIPILPPSEKSAALAVSNIDLQWIAERSSCVWTAGLHDESATTTKTNSTLNLYTIDPWAICLFGFLERARVLTCCPATITHSWPIVFGRVHSLFTVIDPTPVDGNRASLLRSSTAVRKPVNERDIYLHVWKNYVTFAFRVVPPVPSPVVRCASPDLSLSSSPDSLSAERNDNKSPGGGYVSPTALYKLVVPLLRCETVDVRDVVVYALGKVNAEALKDLMEELVIYIREAVDRKQENVRRRRRRDALRLQLVRVLELIAEYGTFGISSASVLDRDTQSLHQTFVEYMDGARLFLESEPDKETSIVKEITLHFCNFIRKMIKSFSLETCTTLLKRDLKRNLFTLFTTWAEPYGLKLNESGLVTSSSGGNNATGSGGMTSGSGNTTSGGAGANINSTSTSSNMNSDHHHHHHHHYEQQQATCTELQLAALQAMSALLCCGRCFNTNGLAEDGMFYPWLDMLLASNNEQIYNVGRETVILLLECNPDIGPLLDWVVDRCYTGTAQVADGCFLALATIFSAREYPCDHYTAIINVTLMNTGCPRTNVHDIALQLLQILDKRFFGSIHPIPTTDSTIELNNTVITSQGQVTQDHRNSTTSGVINKTMIQQQLQSRGTLDALLSTTYSRSQMYLSRQLAQLHPDLTMPMFSEITHRFQTARPEVRQLLLQYILPWLHNMELVDPNVPPANPLSYFQQYYSNDLVGRTPVDNNRRDGWGSVEATEMVLNNLFYITAKFADQHPQEVEECWATLCSCWPNNLKVIIRYLIIVSGMAPHELLPYAKRVVLYLVRSRPDRLLDEMMCELQTVETLNCLIERTETPPFYRLTSMRKASSHSDGTGGPNGPGGHSGNGNGVGANGGHISGDSQSRTDLAIEKGTIHTKRHSGEDPIKAGTSKSDTALRTLAGFQSNPMNCGASGPGGNNTNTNQQTRTEKTRTSSGPPQLVSDDQALSGSTISGTTGGGSNNMITTPTTIADNELLNQIDEGGRSMIGGLQQQTCNNDNNMTNTIQPHPLPMPEYGGYFAPLTEYLPDSSQPISGFHRCNVAVMLLTDVVTDGVPEIDWSIHIPLMLHILFLGMDHTRQLVHEHCRQLLLGLLIVLADHQDHLTVAHLLLNNQTEQLGFGIITPQLNIFQHIFTELEPEFDSYLTGGSIVPFGSAGVNNNLTNNEANKTNNQVTTPTTTVPTTNVPVIVTTTTGSSGATTETNTSDAAALLQQQSDNNIDDNRSSCTVTATNNQQRIEPGPNMSIQDVIKSLIHFLATRENQPPLWNYEDITAKVWSIRSADQLDIFLQHVLRVFRESLPHALISERWAQTALQLGLSCSSRHYAGRSLQVFRALRVPITSRMLSDILSRLVETVAEQGEDMQGYVTELLLTLEAAVDSLESDFRPLDFMKEIFKSTPNLNNKDGILKQRSPGGGLGCGGPTGGVGGGNLMNMNVSSNAQCTHARSTSYSVSYCMRNASKTPPHMGGVRSSCLHDERSNEMSGHHYRHRIDHHMDVLESYGRSNNKIISSSNLSRSRSAQSLKLLGDSTTLSGASSTADDKMTILAQLFWLSVSLLESDYEHEFLLALRLLSRVMHRLPLDRPDARDKVDKLQSQLRWSNFPGVHALLLKGCTHPNIYEPVVTLLSQFTPLLDLTVVDPTQSIAFPMNVIALLPYMLLNYEDANELCIRSAENIAQVSGEKSKKLENLGTVMTLYSRRNFSKESFQWTKCVVKYLHDTYAHLSFNMLAFLVEVLEKGPTCTQLSILSIIHCMLHYVDLQSQSQPINITIDLLRVVAKYLDGSHWKEALKILKLVVTRSSSLVAPSITNTYWGNNDSSSLSSTTTSTTNTSGSSTITGSGGGLTSLISHHPPHPSFSETEIFMKKELPGRTMEFTFDLSQTPVIGRRFLIKNDANTCTATDTNTTTSTTTSASNKSTTNTSTCVGLTPPTNTNTTLTSPRRSVSLSPADAATIAGWKRPWMCQSRVRECLVNLLTTCGQRVGLPKSPSVIFSQSSDLMERQSSMASSTEEVSGTNNDLSGGSRRDDATTEQFGVFKDFDFLEYESESVEGESTDNFNWGVRRRPLSEGDNHGSQQFGEAHQSSSSIRLLEDSSSISEKTPILSCKRNSKRDRERNLMGTNASGSILLLHHQHDDQSSDDDIGSESPLDEVMPSAIQQTAIDFTQGATGMIGQSSSANSGQHVQHLQQHSVIPSSLSLHHHHHHRGCGGGGSNTSVVGGTNEQLHHHNSSSSSQHHHHHRHQHHHRTRHDSSTRSDTSGSSAGDLGDVTPCNASPNLSGIIGFRPITRDRDDIEELWRQQLRALLTNTPSNTLELFHQLYRLIRDVENKTIIMTRESCHYLNTSISINNEGAITLGTYLQSVIDMLTQSTTHYEPLIVWFDPLSIINTRLADSLRFCLLEIQEHLETFFDRQDHAVECMDAVKAFRKLDTLELSEQHDSELLLDLGRSIYKLHFQLLLLIETSHKMAVALRLAAKTSSMQDLSNDIYQWRAKLRSAVDEVNTSNTPPTSPSPTSNTSIVTITSDIDGDIDDIETTIIDLIQNEKWLTAIQLVKRYRDILVQNNNIILALYDHDVIILLNLYCKYIMSTRPGVYIICGGQESELVQLYNRFYIVSTAIQQMEINLKEKQNTTTNNRNIVTSTEVIVQSSVPASASGDIPTEFSK